MCFINKSRFDCCLDKRGRQDKATYRVTEQQQQQHCSQEGMDLSYLDSFLNDTSDLEFINCTNQGHSNSSFEFDLSGDSGWVQFVQEPSPLQNPNSCLESLGIVTHTTDTNVKQYFAEKSNNDEEAGNRNSGINWSSSHTRIPSILSFGNPGSPVQLHQRSATKKVLMKQKTKRSRAESANRQHMMAERKRRERVAEYLYVLQGLVPGLKKRDKGSVLTATVQYLREMQEKVKALGEEVAKHSNVKAPSTNEQSKHVSVSSTEDEPNPVIDLKDFGKTILIKILCFPTSKGTLVKALNVIESHHLRVVTANSVQISDQILDLRISSQVEEGFEFATEDLSRSLMLELGI